jgi:nucleoside-triphosphatase THEP1
VPACWEAASDAFRAAVEETLAGEGRVLGTILRAAHPWADRIKAHPGVTLIEVTVANRATLPGELAERLRG